ncbi:hypothetical protein ACVGOW_20445 [Pseudonocardia saturnea]
MTGAALTLQPVRLVDHEFLRMINELERRSMHQREAGAFLLAAPTSREVTAVAYYDDLDPYSLTGGITFHASGYTRLNQLCRERGLRVLADIHLHPGEWTGQSPVDAAHPMIARAGHLALIAPSFGSGVTRPQQLGAHLKTTTGWQSFNGKDVRQVLEIENTLRGRVRRMRLRAARCMKGRFS